MAGILWLLFIWVLEVIKQKHLVCLKFTYWKSRKLTLKKSQIHSNILKMMMMMMIIISCFILFIQMYFCRMGSASLKVITFSKLYYDTM